jgi:hypothetical protein
LIAAPHGPTIAKMEGIMRLVVALLMLLAAPVAAQDAVRSQAASYRVEILARGLENPWGAAFLPDGRVLLTERPGRLRVYANGTLSEPIPGVPEVWARGQGGLHDVAADRISRAMASSISPSRGPRGTARSRGWCARASTVPPCARRARCSTPAQRGTTAGISDRESSSGRTACST